MRNIDFIVPVYNNNESLEELVDILTGIGKELGNNFRIICVDDGSKDDSLATLERIRKVRCKDLINIQLIKNYGQLAAIFAGFEMSNASKIVVISADLQDDAGKIVLMSQALDEGFEVAACHRVERAESSYRQLTSWIAYKIARLGYPEMPRGGFDYFMLSRIALNEIIENQKRTTFLQGAILRLGFPIKWIPYKRISRKYGKSQWTFRKKVAFLLDILFESTLSPLRFISFSGALVSLFSVFVILQVSIGRLVGKSPFDGFAFIVSLICFFGGLSIFSIGILGEYILRMLKGSQITSYKIKSIFSN